MRKIASVLGIALCASIAAAQTAKFRMDPGVAVDAVLSGAVKSCPSIETHGGSTGSADNGPALVAALAASPGDGQCVSFPPGRFTFASAVTFRLPDGSASVTLSGAGADVTELNWPNGGGLTFEFVGQDDSVHVRDLSLTTGTAGAGRALVLQQSAKLGGNPADNALSDVSRVSIHGADGYAVTDYWETGVAIVGVSNVNMTGLVVTGPGGEAYASHGQGVVLEGSADDPLVVFNIAGATFNYLLKGLVYGNEVEGVTISQSNFTGDSYGIFVPNGLNGLDQLAVTSSQFNCALAGVYVGSYTSDTLFSSNLFIVPNTGTGILLERAYLYSAVGNAFNSGSASMTSSHPVGIEIGPTAGGGTITGNLFDNMAAAVVLEKGSTGGNVQSNEYSNDPVKVRNLGSGNQVGGGSP
jgi:hypothetical protein